jgi:hypothetical protein
MKTKYRIYVLGPVPADLKERIIAAHVAAILKAKIEDIPVSTQTSIDEARVSLRSDTHRARH